MPGDNKLYMLARRTLLDALDALDDHRNAIVLVGAQAVYLHTGESSDIAVSPFTTDADLALDPSILEPVPDLKALLRAAQFSPKPNTVGIWEKRQEVDNGGGTPLILTVDFLVPATMGGRRGKGRGADLGQQGKDVARQARGLEATFVDQDQMDVEALESGDNRHYRIAVAGPTALLIAKVHKIGERLDEPGRLKPKDALDSLRLLRAIETPQLAQTFKTLRADPRSREVAEEALTLLERLFATQDSEGSRLAVQAVGPLDDPATIAASCADLTQQLLQAVRRDT